MATKETGPLYEQRVNSRWRGVGVSIAIIVLLVGGACYLSVRDFHNFLQRPLNVESGGTVIRIEPGSSLMEIARSLEEQKILEHQQYFVLLAYWKRQEKKIQAGEYRIAPEQRPEELLRQLVEGRVVLHGLTLIEGWTFRQVIAAINQHEAIEHRLVGLSDIEIMTLIGHQGEEHPEGRFFPDTYIFPRDTTDIKLLKGAYERMDEVLRIHWKHRQLGLPFSSPYEALILASVIERETALDSERSEVAGVFVRRLRQKMKLQTDPSVIYGLGDKFDGKLKRKDLEQDTPYNTYLHFGLPPTPICMPSLGSIRAALKPASGESLYFVARGDGSHYFSSSLEEHHRAVNEYQRKPPQHP